MIQNDSKNKKTPQQHTHTPLNRAYHPQWLSFNHFDLQKSQQVKMLTCWHLTNTTKTTWLHFSHDFARLINVNWKRTAVTSQHATLTLLCLFKGLLSIYFAASYQSYCQNKQREYFNMLPADYSFSYWLKFKAMIDSWKGKKTYQTTAYCEFSSCSLKK